MFIDVCKNFTHEKKMFCVFLIIHLVVWTCVGLIRTVLPTDALEGIYWGSLQDFGTPKHPPLAGWLTYLAYLPFKSDFCVYLMSQFFIIAGFIYIYRLAKKFLDENSAMLSVIILEGCWVYSYITGYYGFNPDVVLLFTLPAISFYFYDCMSENKAEDWFKMGLIVGISCLNKYQTAFLLLPMLIWACLFKRDIFKNRFFYFSVILAFLIFLPHLLWLFKYDFFPFLYFEGELTATSWYNHITAPLLFLAVNISLIASSLIIFALLKKKFNSPFKFVENYNKKDFWFLMLLGFVPLVVHLVMGLIEGGTMRPRWGFEFWFLTGIMLFYFFPVKISEQEFKFTLKSAYVVMFIIFLALGGLLSVEQNYRSRYPVAKVFGDLNSVWTEKVGTPLNYVGGYIEWTLPLTIYGDTHPKTILDTHGYKDPWIDSNDLKKSGAMIVDRTYDSTIGYVRMSCPYLSEDFVIEPVEYKFEVRNFFGFPREYTIYYFVVPPIDDK
ncbi:glycosyltransferase family 39 protein [bacterium]|nr:glycosyltransferase family 39 protein [bacterium]